ncbi:hypothetical protein VC83_04463 [Pseudogymnoascus destructans]|uniref:Peroxisomal membrane protein 4 n=2 Tax=Pseudogymnoascus destructans TaxID=655981 RepID=L8FYZ7_PSED2|nr:uncharacterized protein VC83_04463 [Pseudogymnoascus destructans]ELR05764.1 hypothetical protein GMDG_01842 [Pseudogymnoascus destructans 20631-21]OAF59066.1 hypothetical protein VC83_04463 [Pseudogymnoascus destructans]
MATANAVYKALNEIVLNPKYADLFALVKAARNGAVYGAKIRFPHALVMIFLFRSGTFREKARLVYKATRTHAQNLSRFAVIYKMVMIALRRLNPTGKEGPYDTFFAGLMGGYVVFGQRNPRTGNVSGVSQQIVIYIFARVVLGLAKLSVEPSTGIVTNAQLSNKIKDNAWPVFAAMSWGAVMYVFRWHPDSLQSSLRSSMSYIYVQSDHWDSLKTLVWHNK